MRCFRTVGFASCLSLAAPVFGQVAPPAAAPADAQPIAAAAAPAAVAPPRLVLARDTPVHLMVLNEVTTKTHAAGHRFKLRVNEPVRIGEAVIIPIGATAWGEVLAAESSGNFGKSGKLAARLLYVEANGRNIAIAGEASAKGSSGTAETVMGVIGLGIFGLFAKGNNAKLKAGELMTAFTVEDIDLTSSPAPAAAAPSAPPALPVATAAQ